MISQILLDPQKSMTYLTTLEFHENIIFGLYRGGGGGEIEWSQVIQRGTLIHVYHFLYLPHRTSQIRWESVAIF